MNRETRTDRIHALRREFEKGVEFHAEAFREIDAKAKYWLTLSLPSFLGALSFLVQQGPSLSDHLVALLACVATLLVAAAFCFAQTLWSLRIESGILSPGDEGFESSNYYLASEERWAEMEEEQAKAACNAFISNEKQNNTKSRRLARAELLLFRGLPLAACLAVGASLLHAASSPLRLGVPAGTATGVATGIAVGTLVVAALLSFDHLRNSTAK